MSSREKLMREIREKKAQIKEIQAAILNIEAEALRLKNEEETDD